MKYRLSSLLFIILVFIIYLTSNVISKSMDMDVRVTVVDDKIISDSAEGNFIGISEPDNNAESLEGTLNTLVRNEEISASEKQGFFQLANLKINNSYVFPILLIVLIAIIIVVYFIYSRKYKRNGKKANK